MTPKSTSASKRLRRLVAVKIREIRDGCLECRRSGMMCDKHDDFVVDIVTNPRKYLAELMRPGEPEVKA